METKVETKVVLPLITDEQLQNVVDIYTKGGNVPAGLVLLAIATELQDWRQRLAKQIAEGKKPDEPKKVADPK